MSIPPVPLEKTLRAEYLTRLLPTLQREELEAYTAEMIRLTTKLTHYTQVLTRKVVEYELGLKVD